MVKPEHYTFGSSPTMPESACRGLLKILVLVDSEFSVRVSFHKKGWMDEKGKLLLCFFISKFVMLR